MRISYFLPLCCLLQLFLQSCEPVKRSNSQLTNQIKQPTLNDFYTLASITDHKYLAKVDTFSQDSIDLIYLTDDPGSKENPSTGELLLKRKPMQTTRLAKSDLIASENNRGYNDGFFGKVILHTLNNHQPLEVQDIDRYTSTKELKIYIKDTLVENSVSELIPRFINASVDDGFTMMDSASLAYFQAVLKVAASDDVSEIKSFILNSEYPEVEYHVVLFTKYLFLKSTENKKSPAVKDLLKQYALFYRMFCPGLWSMDFPDKELKIQSVTLKGLCTAEAYLRTQANILEEKQFNFMEKGTPSQKEIEFATSFNFENDAWKINIPSTYSYIYRQIRQVSHNPKQNWDKQTGKNGEIAYRKLIRDQITASDPTLVIDEQLVY